MANERRLIDANALKSETPMDDGEEYHVYMLPDNFCSYGEKREVE